MGRPCIVVLFVVLFASVIEAANPACTPGDLKALLGLKASITRDPQRVLSSWNSTNCCRGWTGITCNKGRVINLQLPNYRLSGSLPSSIGSLEQLVKFDMSYNHLTGAIPKSIGSLSKLQLLDVAYNYGIQGQIPDSIGKLSSLVRLRMQSNKLTGGIPPSFGKLSSLVYAELDDNDLSGQIPDEFTFNLTSLAFLELSKNRFTGLPKNLSNLARLGILYLSSNKLSFDSVNGIATLPILGELHIANAGLKGQIPRWLATLNLRQSDDFLDSLLDLSHNFISGSIPSEIQQISNLERLLLNNNNITGHIPASMGNLTGLELVDMSHNTLTGSMPTSLLALTSLKGFNVSSNLLSGEIPQGEPFSSLDASSFAGNPGLCGKPLPACPKQ